MSAVGSAAAQRRDACQVAGAEGCFCSTFEGTAVRSAAGVADWHLVFRQSVGTYLTKEEWHHVGSPDSENFSILDELERFRDTRGKFVFKMLFPDMQAPNYNVWSQISNPVTATSGGVDGYAAIEIHFDSHHWGGLERSARETTLLDGSVHEYWWFYAVGTTIPFFGGIPGPSKKVDKVELYVWEGTCCWHRAEPLFSGVTCLTLIRQSSCADLFQALGFGMLGVRGFHLPSLPIVCLAVLVSAVCVRQRGS